MAVVLTALTVCAVAGFRFVTNPSRHFLNYVHAYATHWRSSAVPRRPQQDEAWIYAHPTAVIAEGQRACHWLAVQPDAPSVDSTGRSDMSRMAMRFVTEAEGNDVPLARLTKWRVVGGAWNYLCAGEMSAKTAPRSAHDD